eukprot:1157716-Pelagomonas_calceolata.AAC.9
MVASAERVVPCWLPTPETISKQTRASRQTTYSVDRNVRHSCQHACKPNLGNLLVLGVKRTTSNWTVFRECGQEPLQFF